MKYGKEQTKNLQKELEKKNLDAVLLANLRFGAFDQNFYYFTGCQDFESSFLIIGRDFETLIVPSFEVRRAKGESWIREVVPLEKNILKKIAKELKGMKVGIDEKALQLGLYRKLRKNKIKMQNFAEGLENLRMLKTSEEISRIKKACKITNKLYKKVNFSKSENKIAADLRIECERLGAKFFDPIIAFDKNAAYAHAKPTNSKGKEVLMVDLSAIYKNYYSDMTRTFVLNWKNSEIKKAYEVCKEAQEMAIDKIKPGVKASYIDKICRDYLKKNGYILEHATGHGIGLEIHEEPSISPKSKEILKEGMVFTVEPGIYLKNKFGVRIEDNVLVTKNGCKILSK